MKQNKFRRFYEQILGGVEAISRGRRAAGDKKKQSSRSQKNNLKKTTNNDTVALHTISKILTVKVRNKLLKMGKKTGSLRYCCERFIYTYQYLGETHGVTLLHFACADGLSPRIISQVLKFDFNATAAEDKYGWIPLHFAVDSLCKGIFSLQDGMKVVRLLCKEDASVIHKSDKKSNTPLDIVQIAMMSCNRMTKANKQSSCEFQDCRANLRSIEDLQQIYCELKQISINVYRQTKKSYESHQSKRIEILNRCPQSPYYRAGKAPLDTLSTIAFCDYSFCDYSTGNETANMDGEEW